MSGTLLLFLLSISFAQVCYTATCGEELITNGGFETVDYGCATDFCQINFDAIVPGWYVLGGYIVRGPTFSPISGVYSISSPLFGQPITKPPRSRKCTISIKTNFLTTDQLGVQLMYESTDLFFSYDYPKGYTNTFEVDVSSVPDNSDLFILFGGITAESSFLDDISVVCQCSDSCVSDNFLVISGNFTRSEASAKCASYNSTLADVTAHNVNQSRISFSNCGLSNTTSRGWINSWDGVPRENLAIQNTAIFTANVSTKYNAVCNRPSPVPVQNTPCSVGGFTIRIGIFNHTEAVTACGAGGLAAVNQGNKGVIMELISTCFASKTVWVKSWDGNDYGNACNVFSDTGNFNYLGAPGSLGCNNRFSAVCKNV
eukprot:TRINITY_DN403_c0_g2_i2.p1 TRINITY_DN403_c0_g2~~TRINITY_DN403_c0_g2_i2.p1  ORF type:complete len:381 (+),score=52.52 TRINITY_DN403_c0_g2_i2:29-1144(+)